MHDGRMSAKIYFQNFKVVEGFQNTTKLCRVVGKGELKEVWR